jgi:hypothetical protein
VKRILAVIGAIVLLCALLGCETDFKVRRVSPAVGVIAGGEPIDILGSGFSGGMGITVYFGSTKADNVVVRSSDKLTVTSPSHDGPGTVDVRIITDDGKEFVLKEAFQYVPKGAMDIRDLGQRKSLREKAE